MHDNPRATEQEQEQEQAQTGRLEEEETMRGYRHGDPELPADGGGEEQRDAGGDEGGAA